MCVLKSLKRNMLIRNDISKKGQRAKEGKMQPNSQEDTLFLKVQPSLLMMVSLLSLGKVTSIT